MIKLLKLVTLPGVLLIGEFAGVRRGILFVFDPLVLDGAEVSVLAGGGIARLLTKVTSFIQNSLE